MKAEGPFDQLEKRACDTMCVCLSNVAERKVIDRQNFLFDLTQEIVVGLE